jgi:predicted MFS family arabinose efflux permease
MNGWTLAKYLLAIIGVLIVVAADHYGAPSFGWIGLGLILAAFFLRFWQRASARRHEREPSPPPGGEAGDGRRRG